MIPIKNKIELNDYKQVSTLILEDEPTELLNLVKSIEKIPNNKIIATASFEEAKQIAINGKCSYLITDLRINQKKGNRIVPIMASKILKNIKNKGLFIPSIATSFYKDQLDEVRQQNAADYCIEKEDDSVEKIKTISESILSDIQQTKACLYEILVCLWNSCEVQDLEEKNYFYKRAKQELKNLTYNPKIVPEEHRKCLFYIRNIVSSMSAIGSQQFGLHSINKTDYHLIEKVAMQCVEPKLNQNKLATNLDKLNIRRISYLPKIDIG